MAYPGMHTLKCRSCQSLAINYRCLNWASNPTQWSCQGCLEVQTPRYCLSCDKALAASHSIPKPEHHEMGYKRADGLDLLCSLPPLKPDPSPSQALSLQPYTSTFTSPPSSNLSLSKTSKTKPNNEIIKLGCNPCRSKFQICSRLHGNMSKCEACDKEGLECDCSVMRRICEYCSSRHLRCGGNEEDCDNCVRFGVDCLPLEKGKGKGKEVRTRDVFDVIDGIKASLAMEDCEGCEGDRGVRCDRAIEGCVHCKEKGVVCMYRVPVVGSLSEKSSRFCTSCRKPKFGSMKSHSPLCDQCKIISINKSESNSVAKATCHACRIMKTTCDAEGEICIPCQKQDFRCIRTSSQPQGPPQRTHQRGLVSHLIHRAEMKSKDASWAKNSEGEIPDSATNLSEMDSTTFLPPRPNPRPLAENDLKVVSPRFNELIPLTSPTKETPIELNNQHKVEQSNCGNPSSLCLEQKVTKVNLPPVNPSFKAIQYPRVSYPIARTQPPISIRKKAQRAAQACGHCRKIKAKCDEGRPGCKSCKEKGIDCVYAQYHPTPKPYLIPSQRSFQPCNKCRNLASKCDEGVPSCTRCKQNGVECVYVNKGGCLTPEMELGSDKAEEAAQEIDNNNNNDNRLMIPTTNIPLLSPSTTAHPHPHPHPLPLPEQAKAKAKAENHKNTPLSIAAQRESDDEITAKCIPDQDQVFADHPEEKEEEEKDWCIINSSDAVVGEVAKGRMFGFW